MVPSLEQSIFFANQFAISCGTVSTGEYLLPKGRKDLGEGLEDTATRETFEETGIPVQLLPVNIETMATLPSSMRAEGSPTAVTEPFAVTQRVNKGILKIIFWYVARADSTAIREEGTQDEDEDFDTIWVGFNEIESVLSFDDDKGVAHEAIAVIRWGQVAA